MATQTSSHLLPFITRSFGSKHLNLIDHYILSLMQPKLLKRVKDQQKNNSFILQTGICLFRYSNQLIKLRISSPGLCDDKRRFHRFTFSYKDTLAFKTKTFGATHLLKRGSFSIFSARWHSRWNLVAVNDLFDRLIWETQCSDIWFFLPLWILSANVRFLIQPGNNWSTN